MQYFLPIWFTSFICYLLLGTKARSLNILNNSEGQRIVHGYRCPIEAHPYMVSIQYTSTTAHHCGGTLISQFWILTAGHCCIKKYIHGTYSAVAGMSIVFNRHFEQDYLITRNYRYSMEKTEDIGLMELDYPMDESPYVQYVQIASYLHKGAFMERTCKEFTVIGWGDQYAKGADGKPLSTPISSYDPYLQCVNLTLMTKTECDFSLGYDTSTLICAYTRNKGACQKDSGGPLMCNDIQYGIVVYGVGCAFEGNADVFTRVEVFEHFIRRIILGNKVLSHLCNRANYLIIIQYLIFVLYCK